MKVFSPSWFVSILTVTFLTIFALCLLFPTVFAENSPFPRNLKLGDSGQDVLQLQKFLNIDPETAVASEGVGSAGQETTYFGPKTGAAVNKFQSKYRQDILISQGFSAPTGMVGPATRQKLTTLYSGAQNTPISQTPVSMTVPKSVSKPASSATPTPKELVKEPVSNPNLVNLDKFVSAVNTVGKKQGFSGDKLAVLDKGIKKSAERSEDYRKKFKEALSKAKTASSGTPKPFALGNLVKNLLSFVGFPQIVEAQGAGEPFGGALYYAFFCTCTGNWLIFLEPLPPTYVMLLTYYEGSQQYANYNTPFTSELLGFYSYGGQCEEYIGEGCVELPSEGQIDGFIGSAGI